MKLEPNKIDTEILNAMKQKEWYTSTKLGKLVIFSDLTIKKSLFKLTAMKLIEMEAEETKQSTTGYKYIWRRL